KAHRFVRLWRRLGLAMWDVDQLLAARPIDDATLTDIAALRRLQDRTGLDWTTLVTVFAGFDDHGYVDRSVNEGVPVQTLYQRLFRNRLVDSVGSMPPTLAGLSGTITVHIPGLLAGLRINEADLGAILADQSLDPNGTLDVAT